MSGPLQGVTVVELGVWVAGPAAAGVLGDWGADVIKIEPLRGDPARSFQHMFGGDRSDNPVFELDNRNKRSIAVDITTPDGRQVAYELLDTADVFVTNVRVEALKRAGFDYETLQKRQPRLIYGLITGYGLHGPDANRPGFDIAAFWARSGMAHLLTPEGGDLPIQRGGMGDHSTGVTFAGAICAALFQRERSGQGQMVSTSLLRQGVYTVGFDLNMYLGWGRHQAIGRRDSMVSPTVNNYQTADGKWFWVVGVEGDRHWPPLTRVVGHPEWMEDPRFNTARNRAINRKELIALLDEAFSAKSLEEWTAIFDTEPDMFWSPVNSAEDVLNDPQLAHAGGFIDVPHESGTTTMIASPADFHGTPGVPRWIAPGLGEHSIDILRQLGRSEEQITAMIDAGVVGRPEN